MANYLTYNVAVPKMVENVSAFLYTVRISLFLQS